MSTASDEGDRIPMSQRERDRLRVLHSVLEGQRTQVEAAGCCGSPPARSAGCCCACNMAAMRPSSMACVASPPTTAWMPSSANVSFGPTARTTPTSAPPSPPRSWPSAAWRCPPRPCGAGCSPRACGSRTARREPHRSRRPRRACFGELVQMDASIHDWLEGRGEGMVLIDMIDDATSRSAGALLRRRHRLRPHGPAGALAAAARPPAGVVHGPAQHLRGAGQGAGLARRPDAVRPGAARAGHRVDPGAAARRPRGGWSGPSARPRTGGSRRCVWPRSRRSPQANELLDGGLLAKHNRMFSVPPREAGDAHRAVGGGSTWRRS